MSTIFKKSASERALGKAAKKKYNESKRKLNPAYVKGDSLIGFKTDDMRQIATIVKLAEAVEIASV